MESTLTGPQRGEASATFEELRHQTMDSGHSFRVGVSRTDQLHPDVHNLICYWPLPAGVFSSWSMAGCFTVLGQEKNRNGKVPAGHKRGTEGQRAVRPDLPQPRAL